MSITDGMYQLGHAAQRLNRGSDVLNETLRQIDEVLGRLNIGMEFTLPRPLHEDSTVGSDGKRVILMGFLAYARIKSRFRLVYRTVKILESRRDSAMQSPGDKVPLMDAPRRVRHLAVDQLPELVGGLAQCVDEVLNQLDRRQSLAANVLSQLEGMLSAVATATAEQGAASPLPGFTPVAQPYPAKGPTDASERVPPPATEPKGTGNSERPTRKTAPGHLGYNRR
jgi:hypothetical protein